MKKILLFIKNHREKRSSLKLLKESMIIISILIIGLIFILFIGVLGLPLNILELFPQNLIL